jgi:hypothetical protein
MGVKPISRCDLFDKRTASSWHYLRQNLMIVLIINIHLFYNVITGAYELSSTVTKNVILINNLLLPLNTTILKSFEYKYLSLVAQISHTKQDMSTSNEEPVNYLQENNPFIQKLHEIQKFPNTL